MDKRRNFIFEFKMPNEQFKEKLKTMEDNKVTNSFMRESVDIYNKLKENNNNNKK